MKLFKLLSLFVLPFLLGGCQNKSSDKPQNLISLSESNITLPEDQTHQLQLTIDDSLKDYLVFWNIRDENIATVEDGLITALNVGDTLCTVQVGKYTASCLVHVVNYEPDAALNIDLENDTYNLNVDDTFELPIQVKLGSQIINDYQISGDVSNTSIASFNSGVITALAVGECDILLTVTYQEYVAHKLIYISVY